MKIKPVPKKPVPDRPRSRSVYIPEPIQEDLKLIGGGFLNPGLRQVLETFKKEIAEAANAERAKISASLSKRRVNE